MRQGLGSLVLSCREGAVRARLYRRGGQYTLTLAHDEHDRVHGMVVGRLRVDREIDHTELRAWAREGCRIMARLPHWPTDNEFDDAIRPHMTPVGVHQ